MPIIPAEQISVEEVELMRRSTGSQTAQTGEASVHYPLSSRFKPTSAGVGVTVPSIMMIKFNAYALSEL
jgi:hypothetical protein